MTHRLSRNIRYHLITYPLVAILLSTAIFYSEGMDFQMKDIYLLLFFPWVPFAIYLFIESRSKTVFFDDYDFYIYTPFTERHLETHHLSKVIDVMSWFFIITIKYMDGTEEKKLFAFLPGAQSFKELLSPRSIFQDTVIEEKFKDHVAQVKGRP